MARPLILLVDETEFFLGVERQFLRDSDVTVLTASHPDQALELARQHHPVLVYMDRGAPEMFGVRSCAAMKADPSLQSIPIVLICADTPGEKQLCAESGCDAVLTKPLDRTRFLDLGRKFLPDIDRREQRVLCYTTVFYRYPGGHAYGKCVDVSIGGLFVETDQSLSIGEQIDLSFTLPGMADLLLELQGKVVWINDPEKPCRSSYPGGFGVQFCNADFSTLQPIRSFVAQHLPRQQQLRTSILKPSVGI